MLRTAIHLSLLASVSAFATQALAEPLRGTEAVAAVDELVVTAQRRAERLVDVPVSISVVTGDQLEKSGVSGSTQLPLVTPGLNMTIQGHYTQPTIRGIGTTVVGPGADPNVSIYVDGVYQPNQTGALLEFNNLERIEVLKGPQGTLYGRNATGGAIAITTKAPTHEFSGEISARYGRFNDRQGTLFLNVPLTDRLAANIAVLSHRNDGYTKNVARNNEDTSRTNAFGVRGRVLFEPTDNLKFILTASHVYQSNTESFSYGPYRGNSNFPNSLAVQLGLDPSHDRVALNTKPIAKFRQNSVSLSAEWATSLGTLTSITSFSDIDNPFQTDLDATENASQRFYVPNQTEQTTIQEISLSSKADTRLSWIVGGQYYHDGATSDSRFYLTVAGAEVPLALVNALQYTDAAAGYAEVTYGVTDRLKVLLGGRYSWEHKHALQTVGPGGRTVLDATHSWNAFTTRASVRYEITPDSRVYFTFSQGFKSGLFDAGVTSTVPVQPEKVNSFELGYKLSTHNLRLSGATYFTKYKNIQLNAFNLINQTFLLNAAAAEIYGAELEAQAHLGEHLSLRTGGAYTHAQYSKFPNAITFSPLPIPPGGNVQVAGDVTGNRLVRTPEWTGFATLEFSHPLPVGALNASLTGSYTSRYYFEPSNQYNQPPAFIVNGQVSWTSPSETWRLSLLGENLTNKRTIVYARRAGGGDFASWSRPRWVALKVDYAF